MYPGRRTRYNRLTVRRFGKYRLVERVASGGMAEVWRAEVPGAAGFVKEVALKLVRADQGQSDAFLEMFIREARLASRLSHANIVQVFDFDEVEGRHYIAMEYVHGRTLRQVWDACREAGLRFGLPRTVHVGAEVARALAHAHRAGEAEGGIVHRDVSPQNILVSFAGEVKLTDFGIARAMGMGDLTAPGTVKGKLAYMAPEQARGEAVDGRADVFSLGVVLWELCAGRRLFARESDAATMEALLSAASVSRPSEWNEEVTAELDATILAALERDPARRTSSAQELADALGRAVLELAKSPGDIDLRLLMGRLWPDGGARRAPEPTVVRPASPAPPAAEPSTRTAVSSRPAAAPARRRRGLALGIGLVALAALGILGFRALRGGAPVSRAEAPGPEAPMARPAPAAPAPDVGTGQLPTAPEAAAVPATTMAATEPSAPEVQVLAERHQLDSLRLPPPSSGEGILSVNAAPWGRVHLGGRIVGETPLELRLPAGRYRVRVSHPRLGSVEKDLEVRPGRRARWLDARPKR